MSMILRKTNRVELIEQLEQCSRVFKPKTSSVVIAHRSGNKSSIVKIEETENGVFLCPFETKSAIVDMAPLFNSKVHYYTAEEIINALKSCHSDDVYLSWPVATPCVVIGKMLACSHDGNMTVILIPVPKDIDRINEEVRKMCARSCDDAKKGLQCGACPKLTDCKIIEEVDRQIAEIKK